MSQDQLFGGGDQEFEMDCSKGTDSKITKWEKPCKKRDKKTEIGREILKRSN